MLSEQGRQVTKIHQQIFVAGITANAQWRLNSYTVWVYSQYYFVDTKLLINHDLAHLYTSTRSENETSLVVPNTVWNASRFDVWYYRLSCLLCDCSFQRYLLKAHMRVNLKYAVLYNSNCFEITLESKFYMTEILQVLAINDFDLCYITVHWQVQPQTKELKPKL